MVESTFFGYDSEDEVLAETTGEKVATLCSRSRKNSEASLATCGTATPTGCGSLQLASQEWSLLVDEAFSKAGHQEGQMVSEEGKELAAALRGAQDALDMARQFVTSPSLQLALPLPAESAPVNLPSAEPAYVQHTTEKAMPVRPQRRRHTAPRPPPRLRPTPPVAPAVSSATATSASKLAQQLGSDAAERQRVNALHARFGQAAARARVTRARSLETADRLQQQAIAEAAAIERTLAQVAVAAGRCRAARRAASEQRARQDSELEEQERQRLLKQQKEEQRELGQLHAKIARRRIESERARKNAVVRDVLSNLHLEQAERKEAGLRKGQELQARCQEADWSSCGAKVASRRPPQCKSVPLVTRCGEEHRAPLERRIPCASSRDDRSSSCKLPLLAVD